MNQRQTIHPLMFPMKSARLDKPHPLANTTPFPNVLFEWMPELKDSEWRLICLIVRGTWGWRTSSGERKQSDWLTQRQLMKRTGRSSEAVSRAVDSLVRRGLIEVRDANGDLLRTPAERRRGGGRLYFSVQMTTDWSGRKSTFRKSEVVGLEPLMSNARAKKPLSCVERDGLKSEESPYKIDVLVSKSGVRKANTTKEIGTKLLQKGHRCARKARNTKMNLQTEEVNERQRRTRLHTGWFHAGSLQPYRKRDAPAELPN